jgi:hypothetical protein
MKPRKEPPRVEHDVVPKRKQDHARAPEVGHG